MVIVLSDKQVSLREFGIYNKIRTDSLSISFGNKNVLSDVSINFKENNVTDIIGPLGCGKTVLIRSLNIMYDMNKNIKISGKVFFESVDLYYDSFEPYQHRRK